MTQKTIHSGWWISHHLSHKAEMCIGNVGQSTQTSLHHQEQGLFKIKWIQYHSWRRDPLLWQPCVLDN